MTFGQLANRLGLSLIDLLASRDEADALINEEVYDCAFIDGLIADGIIARSGNGFVIVEGN